MRAFASIPLIIAFCSLLHAAHPVYESGPVELHADKIATVSDRIDELVFARLRELGLKPANLCSDAVFLRRAYLVVIGTVPTEEETRAFLESTDPDPAAATASLRDVAARLRSVATELHPPVLDDLGLAPAIEGSARQATGPTVDVEITNHAGYGQGQRPPPDIELAAFRIVQEAITNASRHADASHIRVSGEVARDTIEIAVADDGRGLDDDDVEAAQRAGHMGIASMRGRAAATGGELLIRRTDGGGTVVAYRWQR